MCLLKKEHVESRLKACKQKCKQVLIYLHSLFTADLTSLYGVCVEK